MKRIAIGVAGAVATGLLGPILALAQTQEPSGQKTLAATMNVYVFPKQGQDKALQSQDEAACYGWAVENVGTDPFEQAKRAEQARDQADRTKQQAKEAGAGAGAKGAVRGAAVGALIGEIASDDAGEGAAYGAAAGLLRGRRSARRGQQQASQQADQQVQRTQQSTAEQIDNFKKAFSVCLEAKDYLVKY
jgi:hypothetical protein